MRVLSVSMLVKTQGLAHRNDQISKGWPHRGGCSSSPSELLFGAEIKSLILINIMYYSYSYQPFNISKNCGNSKEKPVQITEDYMKSIIEYRLHNSGRGYLLSFLLTAQEKEHINLVIFSPAKCYSESNFNFFIKTSIYCNRTKENVSLLHL